MSYFQTIYAAELHHRAVAVYMYLRDRSNGEGACWPSIGTIARELRLSRSTVQRALNDLYRAGFLEKQNRHRPNGSLTSNLFTIKWGSGSSAGIVTVLIILCDCPGYWSPSAVWYVAAKEEKRHV